MAMKTHTETRRLPYTAQQMFDLVADVARYPEFLPWCMGARIREQQEDMLQADMVSRSAPVIIVLAPSPANRVIAAITATSM